MPKTKKDVAAKRRKWLSGKNLSVSGFSILTEISYNTAIKWFRGDRSPRDLLAKRVLSVFPRFPL